jgi:hypothetical protein
VFQAVVCIGCCAEHFCYSNNSVVSEALDNKQDFSLRGVRAATVGSGTAISVTHSQCVFVDLGVQHQMRMHHIFIRGLSSYTIFSHIISQKFLRKCGKLNYLETTRHKIAFITKLRAY